MEENNSIFLTIIESRGCCIINFTLIMMRFARRRNFILSQAGFCWPALMIRLNEDLSSKINRFKHYISFFYYWLIQILIKLVQFSQFLC
jgi:hypothetical protein